MELKDHFHAEDVIQYALGIPGIKNKRLFDISCGLVKFHKRIPEQAVVGLDSQNGKYLRCIVILAFTSLI
jgi:hypothetical protein